MTVQEIVNKMRDDINKGIMKVMNNDGYRYYTDVLTESVMVPITTPEETAKLYEKLVINPVAAKASAVDPFDALPRVSMFIGQPDTGKTYLAEKIARDCGIVPLFKMCRDNLNLETLLEDFKLVDGKPVGVREILSSIKESKPYLFKKNQDTSSSNTGFNPAKSDIPNVYRSGMTLAQARAINIQ